MHIQEVASRRYGSALFEVARSEDKIDLYLEQLGDVSNILLKEGELRAFLDHPNITDNEKKQVISNIFKEKIDDEILKLIFLLIDHDRIDEIRVVYYDYKYLVYKERGIKIAYVTTAVEMTPEEIEGIRNKLAQRFDSTIEVQNIIDESIIGGVYLKIGDRVIDGTVKGNLENMRKSLLEQYSEVKA